MKFGAQKISDSLEGNEVDSLAHIREITLHRKVLPLEHITSLMEKKFISESLGGHTLTDEGNYALKLYEASGRRIMR